MTAAASWVGTPAIAEMAEGPHFVARPVILWSMCGLRVGAWALRSARNVRPCGDAEGQSRPFSLKLNAAVGVTMT